MEVELESEFDLVIIGGGVVGLAILRAATVDGGYKCALVEKEAELLHWASGSNSGIICTGVDAFGLERALIRDSISRIRQFCSEMNIPTRPCGSLVCQWPWDESKDRLNEVLAESHIAGDTHATLLSKKEVLEREPNINGQCLGAVHIPGEIVVDPWLYSIAHAVQAVENGAKIYTRFYADIKADSFDGEVWTVGTKSAKNTVDGSTSKCLKARVVINAAGLWADLVQSNTLGESSWQARPRRGQYRVFQSTLSSTITCPIQPVPTQRTKGIFVFSTLYDQIAVGPTAYDQASRTDRSIDPAVAEELVKIGKRILPELVTEDTVMDYVGIRPGSDKRDYTIQMNVEKKWITCAGIRSTGLTASLGIASHVLHLLHQKILPCRPPLSSICKSPLPSIQELVDDFHQRADGSVIIYGKVYKVTHPLTISGWKARTGLAAAKTVS